MVEFWTYLGLLLLCESLIVIGLPWLMSYYACKMGRTANDGPLFFFATFSQWATLAMVAPLLMVQYGGAAFVASLCAASFMLLASVGRCIANVLVVTRPRALSKKW